jgi:nitronate monooxygenase
MGNIPAPLKRGLRLPVIAAPMFLVSDAGLVVAACKAGVIGTVPSLNYRSAADYELCLDDIEGALTDADACFGVNLIVAKQNGRLKEDLEITVRRKVPLVITSFGADEEVVAAIHAYGGLVFHDIASVRHAEKAAMAGVDGVIVLTSGAGGHTGSLNPFAILNETRRVFDGTILLAGALSTGRDIAAAQMAGADFAYMGTRFIATSEAKVADAYRDMMIAGSAADILVTRGLTGVPASFLISSLVAHGLDPRELATRTTPLTEEEAGRPLKAWKEIWSAGQGIGSIDDAPSVEDLVARLRAEYDAAASDFERRRFTP